MDQQQSNAKWQIIGGDEPTDELLDALAELLLELVEAGNHDSEQRDTPHPHSDEATRD